MPINPDALPSPPLGTSTSSKAVNSEKLLGYVLLLIGLVFILVATFSIYRVLTGKSTPPKIFDVESPTFNLPTANLNVPEGVNLPEGFAVSQSNNNSIKIIPDEVYNTVLNMGINYLAMMFIASSGAKIAGIGIKLIK